MVLKALLLMPSRPCREAVLAVIAALMLQHVPAAMLLALDSAVSCMQVQSPVKVGPKAMHAMMATQTQPAMCAMHNWHVLV